MNEKLLTEKKLLTVKQFSKPRDCGWPTESALRALILDAAWGRNNFQKAFVRVNRRVLIDPIEFWRCVDQMQEEPNACK